MNQDMKLQLRPVVTAWVLARHPGAVEVAPNSGQRFVFRADDRAVKLLPPMTLDERERCRREVSFLIDEAVDGLPTVLSELSDVVIEGTDFSVYEEVWIEADSLKTHVDIGNIGPDQALIVLLQGSRILADLHARNVVHRDVSSGNVLLGEAGVSIVDLGLAKYLDLDPLTRTSEHLKMTALFASPEQFTGGSSTLGFPTDIYSLALTAVFAGCGGYAYFLDGQTLDYGDYLARMAHRDYVVDLSGLPEILYEMLNPIASFRPTAGQIMEAQG